MRCVLFTCFAAAMSEQPLPGLGASPYGNLVGMSDFQLNLHPPEEHAQDVEEALDALAKVENAKANAEADDFAMAKQRMLNDEKDLIHDLVSTAFEPLHAKRLSIAISSN